MPLPVAHGLLGATMVAGVNARPTKHYHELLFSGALLAIVPDSDFLLVLFFHSISWHRGFSHSLVSGILVCLFFIWSFGKRHLREALALSLAFASHGVLDYLTTKEGGGVELFWPFSSERWLLGRWGLSEMPSALTSIEIIKALSLEFLLFAPVLLLVLLLRRQILRSRMVG